MRILKFDNPVFQQGVPNLTVRRGIKWAIPSNNETVEIRDSCNKPLGKARIVATRVTRFSDLHDGTLSSNHDPDCRTADGLYRAMCRSYNLRGRLAPITYFKEDEIVTLVYFEVLFCPHCGSPSISGCS